MVKSEYLTAVYQIGNLCFLFLDNKDRKEAARRKRKERVNASMKSVIPG